MIPLCISYPGSGETWIRTILSSLGVDLEYTHHHASLSKEHWGLHFFDLRPFTSDRDKIIFLHRDPRDTTLSFFHQITNQIALSAFDSAVYALSGKLPPNDLDAFVRRPRFGIEKTATFNRNCAHTLRGKYWVTYEALTENTHDEIARLLEYLGEWRSVGEIMDAIVTSRVQSILAQQGANDARFDPKALTDSTNQLHPNWNEAGKDKVGRYLVEMKRNTISYCDEVLSKIGYFTTVS